MDYIWMTARSLTQAQKMMRILSAAGIGAVLQSARGAAAAKGCGYMVRVKRGEENRAKETLQKMGSAPMRIFTEQEIVGREAEHDLF